MDKQSKSKNKKKIIISILSAITITITGTFFYIFRPTQVAEVLENDKDCVVLIHGFLRMPSAMGDMAKFLNENGYRTINIDYPSNKYDIETVANKFLKPAILGYCSEKDRKIHFVTHSLGGLILRHYLKDNQPENIGRIVMIAPPNKGSELADLLNGNPLSKELLGPILPALTTQIQDLPKSINIPGIEIGIIAGTRSTNPITGQIIPGKDDSIVSIESTKLENMTDFVEIATGHTFIVDQKETKEAVLEFLTKGKFQK
ncbi:MAG: alpha/beta fold hydrolase [Candidatus Gracilibacteria bacterium]|jgi:hypothetical protein